MIIKLLAVLGVLVVATIISFAIALLMIIVDDKINHYNMSKLTFTDGEIFDLNGPLHLEERYDGWYVLGNNRMIPVASQDAGRKLIDDELAKVYSIIDIINN